MPIRQTQTAQGDWQLTVSHNKTGVTIPVTFTYNGDSKTFNVTSVEQTFDTGWQSELGDEISVSYYANDVTIGNKRYHVNDWQIGVSACSVTYGLSVVPTSVTIQSSSTANVVAMCQKYVDGQAYGEPEDVTSRAGWTSTASDIVVSVGLIQNNNRSESDKTATVTASYCGQTADVSVLAKGVAHVEEPFLTFELVPTSIGAQGGTVEVRVESNTGWTLSSNEVWAVLGSSTGTGDGTAVLTIAQNEGTNNRTVTITATYAGGTVTRTLTQQAAEQHVTTYSLIINGSNSIPYEGSTNLTAIYKVFVDGVEQSSTDVTTAATWSVVTGNAEFTANGVVKNNNTSSADETATVKASYGLAEDAEKVLTLIGSGVIPIEPTLSLDIRPFGPAQSDWIPASGSDVTLSIESNTDWEIFNYTHAPSFVAIAGPMTGHGSETRQITLSPTFNTTENPRHGHISGITIGHANNVSANTDVIQAGATLILSADTHNVQAGSITHYVYVSATTYWELQDDANWAPIYGSLSGFGNDRREVRFTKNSGNQPRTANISATTSGNGIVRSVEFVQNGAYIRTSRQTLEFGGPSGQTEHFYIYTNLNGVELTCTDQDNRFQVQPITGESGTEITVKTIKDNEWGSSPITETVTVSDADHTSTRFTGTATVNLVQDVIVEEPFIVISGVSVEDNQIPNYGGEVVFTVYWNHTNDGVEVYFTDGYDAPLESGIVISGPNPTGSSQMSSVSPVEFRATFSENKSNQERVIRFFVVGYAKTKSGGRGEPKYEYIELHQSAGYVTPEFTINPTSVTIPYGVGSQNVVISYTGGTKFVLDWDTGRVDTLKINLTDGSETSGGQTVITQPGIPNAEITTLHPGTVTLSFDRQSGLHTDVSSAPLTITMYDIVGNSYSGPDITLVDGRY